MGLATHHDLKGFVVVIAAMFTNAHWTLSYVLPESKEPEYEENDDDCSDQPDDVVHAVFLVSKCAAVTAQRRINRTRRLVPASTTVKAAAKHQNDKHNDEKRCGVHVRLPSPECCVLRSLIFRLFDNVWPVIRFHEPTSLTEFVYRHDSTTARCL
jgi:hypothetical protein